MDINDLIINMTDIIFVLILFISLLIGLSRGFVKEALALTGWFLSCLLAIKYYKTLAIHLNDLITTQILADAISFGIIFLLLVIITTLITHIISKNIQNSLLSPIDKIFGIIFSLVRSILIISIITIFLEKNIWKEKSIPNWIINSHSYKIINTINNALITFLPKNILEINYDLLKLENITGNQNLISDEIINNVDSSDGSYTPSDSNQIDELNNNETIINNESN